MGCTVSHSLLHAVSQHADMQESTHAVNAAVHLAKKAQGTASNIMRTLPPVLLARHDTTTSAGSLNALLRKESLLLTSPNLTSAPLKSCTWSRLCCQAMAGTYLCHRDAHAGFSFAVVS